MQNIKDILDLIVQRFTAGDIENPKLTSELILSHILKYKRTELYLNSDLEISEEQNEAINTIVSRRLKHEPLQYILGETEFYGLIFIVNPSVLIPRPETELLVERIFQNEKKADTILDIGTGSGCIAVSLKHLYPGLKVTALDISRETLEVAAKNAKLNKLNITLILSDLFENINEKFDIIVSNPPYISKDEYENLPSEIQNFEPESALLADDEGIHFYKKILQDAKDYLTENGKIYFEIGFDQADRVKNFALENGYSKVEIYQDLNGFDRIAKIDL